MMYRYVVRLLLPALVGWLALPASAVPRVNHVVVISLDGGKPAVIQESKMPNLQGVLAEGAHTWEARTIFPSKTLPSHTSMLTGVGPAKHHVSWNSWQPERGVVTVPTVFALAKAAGFSTAMFVGKEKFRHLVQPGTVDDFVFPATNSAIVTKTVGDSPAKDDEPTVLAKFLAPHASAYLKEKKPALCFIHFTDPDDVGHLFGWGSPEQKQAFADVDAALGIVLQAIREAGMAGDTVVILSADHGGHRKTHGLDIPEDMIIPWIAWGKGVKPGFAITAPVTTYDTAATVLWLLDLPRPADWDGQPVVSAFQ